MVPPLSALRRYVLQSTWREKVTMLGDGRVPHLQSVHPDHPDFKGFCQKIRGGLSLVFHNK